MPGEDGIVLPNYEKAFISKAKIFDYALNKDHPSGGDKAIAFDLALGFNQSNGRLLIKEIVRLLPSIKVFERPARFGRQFHGVTEMTGPSGKTARVKICWQIDDGTDVPHLTSVYVDKRRSHHGDRGA